LNQERKDARIDRILLILLSFLSWFKDKFSFLSWFKDKFSFLSWFKDKFSFNSLMSKI